MKQDQIGLMEICENWNTIHGFKDLNNPDCDNVITLGTGFTKQLQNFIKNMNL